MIQAMHRCSHLYESGRQCAEPAFEGSDFCTDHAEVPAAWDGTFEPLGPSGFERFVMRVAALLLLLIFLIPFYYTVKSLYSTFAVELGEAR
jgi:hypothetical protein